jgi:hypothetical protein
MINEGDLGLKMKVKLQVGTTHMVVLVGTLLKIVLETSLETKNLGMRISKNIIRSVPPIGKTLTRTISGTMATTKEFPLLEILLLLVAGMLLLMEMEMEMVRTMTAMTVLVAEEVVLIIVAVDPAPLNLVVSLSPDTRNLVATYLLARIRTEILTTQILVLPGYLLGEVVALIRRRPTLIRS